MGCITYYPTSKKGYLTWTKFGKCSSIDFAAVGTNQMTFNATSEGQGPYAVQFTKD
jgi:hypothetical protein